ncbi:pilus assembly protein, partial [bacterium]|nr:pilus assembly protein [bacterium]
MRESKGDQKGVAIVELALILPVVLIISVAVFDLARLYVNFIFVHEVALMGAKLANSSDPEGYAFADGDLSRFYHAAEDEDDTITARRVAFWTNQLDSSHEDFWGLDYFPDKDKKVLNLTYGFAHQLNPRMYFPIPEPLDSDAPEEDLGNRVNCSIEIDFASGNAPALQSTWSSANDLTVLNPSRDRTITVRCAVP